ncbi:MAG TPA: alpha/beta hydrolase [Candidatus Binatia bacterium]|nr:alpha/beta hydrolase [Candidatus Binatia bacterium]
MNAIILHGKPSKERFFDPNFPASSNYYWLPWLQKQLIVNGIPTAAPEVPNNYVADYQTWLKEFERYDVSSDTILVGHSCGGGFMLRWLSENKDIKAYKVVLAAPWLNPKNLEETGDFFDFELDPSLMDRIKSLAILYADDDEESIADTITVLKDKLTGAKFRLLPGYGHFYDDRRMQFPELLEEILK